MSQRTAGIGVFNDPSDRYIAKPSSIRSLIGNGVERAHLRRSLVSFLSDVWSGKIMPVSLVVLGPLNYRAPIVFSNAESGLPMPSQTRHSPEASRLYPR